MFPETANDIRETNDSSDEDESEYEGLESEDENSDEREELKALENV